MTTKRPKRSDFDVDEPISQGEVEATRWMVIDSLTRAWIKSARQEAYDRALETWRWENGMDR